MRVDEDAADLDVSFVLGLGWVLGVWMEKMMSKSIGLALIGATE